MEIPSWATLILAACLICGEAMSPSYPDSKKGDVQLPRSSDSKFYSNNDTIHNNTVEDERTKERTVKKIDNFSENSEVNNYSDDRVSADVVEIQKDRPKKTDKDNRDVFSQDGVSKSTTQHFAEDRSEGSGNANEEEISDVVDTVDEHPVEEDQHDGSINLKAGRTINIFPRYGSLTLTLNVIPSRFGNSWLFREKTSEILKKGSYYEKRDVKNFDAGFDEHYLIDFCDTPTDLYAAYFDHFEIEGIAEAHKAFTSFLSSKKKAQFLGVHGSYLTNDGFSYVLVRLFKTETTSVLDGDLDLSPEFQRATNDIRVGSSESAYQFIDEFGTHVLVEYSLGDVIYQVFVFGPNTYNNLKNTFAHSYQDWKEWRANATSERSKDLDDIREFFSPYLAIHLGEVKMASGNPKFETISEKLQTQYFIFRTYKSIFQILKFKEVEKEVAGLKGKVITGMKLRKITRAMGPSPERYWLSVILDNALSLYYVTM